MKIEKIIWRNNEGSKDLLSVTAMNGWGLVALQPWMTNGTGPHGGYFAPSALFNPRSTDAANP